MYARKSHYDKVVGGCNSNTCHVYVDFPSLGIIFGDDCNLANRFRQRQDDLPISRCFPGSPLNLHSTFLVSASGATVLTSDREKQNHFGEAGNNAGNHWKLNRLVRIPLNPMLPSKFLGTWTMSHVD